MTEYSAYEKTCGHCYGLGTVVTLVHNVPQIETCPMCHGSGWARIMVKGNHRSHDLCVAQYQEMGFPEDGICKVCGEPVGYK